MSELFHNLGIDTKLLLAQAVNFLLVLWLLNRFVFKRVLTFLEERKQTIKKGVELTEKAELEMEKIAERRRNAMAKAKELAQGVLEEAKAAGAAAKKELVEEARAGAETIVEKAKGEAERAQQDALARAKEETQRRAFFLAEKVLSRTLGASDQERMGRELEKELKAYGKEG